jgi:hypothetical protein
MTMMLPRALNAPCRTKRLGVFFTLLACAAAPSARAQLTFGSADGKQVFKIGFLGQFQGEAIDNATATETSKNLFIRRVRVLASYTLNSKLSVFLETDAPNVGKGNPDGTKNTQDLFIQDVHATYAHNEAFNIDAGLFLLAQSYNHEQSAASLMALDYGPYTFIESTPTTSRTGRDYGLRLRGLIAKKLEYRLAVVQGLRGVDQKNPLRFQGRVAFDVFGAQPGFFYRGTSLGKIHTLAIGGNFDVQKSYKGYGGDIYYDRPVGGGDGFTIQGDFTHWDGGSFITSLPKQDTWLVETGFYFHKIKLLPYLQYAKQDISASNQPDEKRPQIGVGYYFEGHNSNLKVAYTRIERDNAPKRNQFQIQYQVFVF